MKRVRLRTASRSTAPVRALRVAFSLLELLAVVTILGIIAVVIIPRIGAQTRTAKIKMCDQYKGDINSAVERYYFDKGTWATSLDDLTSNDYYPSPAPVCPLDGTAYTLDSTTRRVSGHNH